jgi:GTPase SAR1 family protein
VYYKEAFGAMIMFDLSRPQTLDSVKKWKADIDDKVRLPDPNESKIPVILLANKVSASVFLSSTFLAFIFFSLISSRIF